MALILGIVTKITVIVTAILCAQALFQHYNRNPKKQLFSTLEKVLELEAGDLDTPTEIGNESAEPIVKIEKERIDGHDGQEVAGIPENCTLLKNYIIKLQRDYRLYNETQPILNFGHYSAQGFGRLIQHSYSTMIHGASLGRPYLLDLHTRDRYFTWRHFFAPGEFDWSVPAWMDVAGYAAGLTNFEANELAGAHHPDLLPITAALTDELKTEENYVAHLSQHKDKVLYSPNWGTGWFNKIHPSTLRRKFTCNLTPYFLMHKPTEMSETLFDELRESTLRFPGEPFGAIHLRTIILEKKPDVAAYAECFAQHPSIKQWWFITDLPELAFEAAKAFNFIFHHYESAEDTTHSGRPDSTSKFCDAEMWKSVKDFMVLHKSEVTLLSAGAFGETAMWGTRKLPNGRCGELFVYQK